jgi:ATP synthase protein I
LVPPGAKSPQRSKLTLLAPYGYTGEPLPGAENIDAMLRGLDRPIRTVLRWQLLATVALMLVAGAWVGTHGALSAALGGAVSIVSGLAAASVVSLGKAESAGGVLLTVLGAEAVKIGLIVVLLWLVLALYQDVAVPAFIGTFVATVLIFAMAFFVREA